MHRTKKMTVVTTGLALLMAASVSSAMAANNGNDNDNHKVTVCHATGSAKNPYVRIHVSKNAAESAGHYDHQGDEIYEDDVANNHPCPTPPPPDGGDDHDVTICHPLGDGKFERIHLSENDETVGEHAGHDDHIIQDDDNFWPCPGTPGGDDDDDDNGGGGDDDGGTNRNCSASSTSSTEQNGLVNVNLDANNAASNVLCQSQILSNVTASVLGTAIGGSGSPLVSGAGDNCTADSTSETHQVGLVNANVNADNAASNLLCQSQVLSNVTASVLGLASPFGSEVFSGGPGGLFSGLTADVNVLAKVLVLF